MAEKEEEEEEEVDEWKLVDEGRRVVYNKNKWFLVAEWYVAPTERKIGPYGSRNVSDGFIYFIYSFDKEF